MDAVGGTQVIQPGVVQQIDTAGLTNNADKTEIKRLRSENDLYKVFKPEWDIYLAAYEGGPEITNDAFLHHHVRENDQDYKDRLARLHYNNYCDVLVNFFTNFIFAETIHRDGGTNNEWYQTFIKNVDRKGTDITHYMKLKSDDSQIFGMSFTLVDSPPAPTTDNQVLSKQDEIDLNLQPYWVLIKPDEITDWVADEFDVLLYVKRKQTIDTVRSNERKLIERYTEWTPEEITISEIDVTDRRKPQYLGKNIIENAVDYVPIELVRYQRSKKYPYMGNAFLRDFAHNNVEIMNQTSLLQEFLYRQCFNVLAKQVDNVVPYKDQEDGVISQANMLEYPKGADAPKYITPPSDPAKFIQDERQRLINDMFKRAAQDTLNELFNGQGASGFSQAQSFSKTVPFIASRADTLENAEVALMKMTLERLGKQWDGKVKYKDRYELTNITDALTQLVTIFRDLMLPSETFAKEELKRMVHEIDGKIPAEVMQKIEREIEAMDFSAWQGVQKEALIGQPKSPADQQKNKQSGTIAEAAAEAKTKPKQNVAATKKLRR